MAKKWASADTRTIAKRMLKLFRESVIDRDLWMAEATAAATKDGVPWLEALAAVLRQHNLDSQKSAANRARIDAVNWTQVVNYLRANGLEQNPAE